ncbi:UDP-N-acetylmuramoyl-L-alanyl-D-glutamate--2,6-diaminopimelate ligase [Vallitalea okinawensis]|uniref:UDP-N-acetylmuramoyl-L-alanyl-D-glutamate--2, 6-diaminopimelate ligase n=1 Tax=Vallitalea okinawensis TaxID=2078660 RepID=UPI000CFAEBEE|nr:UDP-N-acetylmuramoyl-L-alanyl-D-glutamate--2,6-diaminopimelate ligase [Vallitalea okinawensis]
MRIFDLLKDLSFDTIYGDVNREIQHICWDSRRMQKNSLFIAVKNKNVDRHDYILEAIKNGAIALVTERELDDIPKNVTVIKVKNSRRAMAIIANNYYKEPSKKLKLIGITGTNGKTSVTYFISAILQSLGIQTGIISTIENTINHTKLDTVKLNPTTPDAIELQESFAEMIDKGVTHSVMEVTSAALSQDRVYGCDYDIGVFTNLTRDHLEDHGTMENYKQAKIKLFQMCKQAVVNIDDRVGKEMGKNTSCPIITYGIEGEADFRASSIKCSNEVVSFTLCHNEIITDVSINIPGKFSVYNALAAIASCSLLGFTLDEIIEGIAKIKNIPGRFQVVPNDQNILTVVDYAHSPDGLKNILSSIKEISKGKIITVFGCGGNRDRSKRSIMGEIAGNYSDFCIITSDNPRNEDPLKIIEDVEDGIIKTQCCYEKLIDRKYAILKALDKANTGDSVIIAGKGHENYQIIKDDIIYFSDSDVIAEYFKGLSAI